MGLCSRDEGATVSDEEEEEKEVKEEKSKGEWANRIEEEKEECVCGGRRRGGEG